MKYRGEVLWPHAAFGMQLFQFNSELPDQGESCADAPIYKEPNI